MPKAEDWPDRGSGLLENGMAAALAVVLCCQETLAVVVIEDNVLAFVTDDVLDPAKIAGVLGNEERTG